MADALPTLGPLERRLLLNCARVTLDDRMASETDALLRGPLDWPALLFHARLHSVAPLVHRHVSQAPAAPQVPIAARHRLLELSHATAYRNRLFAAEHRGLMEDFDREGIPFITPKGLVLAERVYGQLALRPLIDLIFLVPERTARRTTRLFLARGYRHKRWRAFDGLYRWSCPQLLFETFRGLKIQVLVFWNAVTWPRLHRFTPGPLWERALPATVTGRPARVLAPEDQVLYLCLQPDHHGYFNRVALDAVPPVDLLFAEWSHNRLIRFADIHETIARQAGALDWDFLVRRAQDSGIDEAAYASLRLTHELCGPIVPPGIIDRLRRRGHHGLRRWIFNGVAADPAGGNRLRARVGGAWKRLRPSWQLRLARLIGLVEVLFPERRLLRLRYGVRSSVGLLPIYAAHAGSGIVRSAATFLRVVLVRAVAGPTQPRES